MMKVRDTCFRIDRMLTGSPDHDHEPPMSMHRLMSLTAMAFLWTGSQIPVYLFGGVSGQVIFSRAVTDPIRSLPTSMLISEEPIAGFGWFLPTCCR